MKSLLKVGGFAVLAAVFGIVGSMFHRWGGEPEAVHAQNVPAEPIKIALLNLQEVSRQSKVFRDLKTKWESFRDDIGKAGAEREAELKELMEKLDKEIKGDANPETVQQIRVDYLTKQKLHEEFSKSDEALLKRIHSKYRVNVLESVFAQAERYCVNHGYDLVLQEYPLKPPKEDEDEFFAGAAWADALMFKPVLFAPGSDPNAAQNKRSRYVTDITAAIVQLVK